MKILSIIPARGNSKSIKLKNLALLNNKPLIYYSIKQSLKSKIINRTIVSTDNKKIAKIALKYGAEVPFLRPKKISKDNSTDLEFILHALKELQKEKYYSIDIFLSSIRLSSSLKLFILNFFITAITFLLLL